MQHVEIITIDRVKYQDSSQLSIIEILCDEQPFDKRQKFTWRYLAIKYIIYKGFSLGHAFSY